jgi:hypothetical protein
MPRGTENPATPAGRAHDTFDKFKGNQAAIGFQGVKLRFAPGRADPPRRQHIKDVFRVYSVRVPATILESVQ